MGKIILDIYRLTSPLVEIVGIDAGHGREQYVWGKSPIHTDHTQRESPHPIPTDHTLWVSPHPIPTDHTLRESPPPHSQRPHPAIGILSLLFKQRQFHDTSELFLFPHALVLVLLLLSLGQLER